MLSWEEMKKKYGMWDMWQGTITLNIEGAIVPCLSFKS